jgi:hypothetical protein
MALKRSLMGHTVTAAGADSGGVCKRVVMLWGAALRSIE